MANTALTYILPRLFGSFALPLTGLTVTGQRSRSGSSNVVGRAAGVPYCGLRTSADQPPAVEPTYHKIPSGAALQTATGEGVEVEKSSFRSPPDVPAVKSDVSSSWIFDPLTVHKARESRRIESNWTLLRMPTAHCPVSGRKGIDRARREKREK